VPQSHSIGLPSMLRTPKRAARLFGDLKVRPTLVHLAKREALATIFTVDHPDFDTYRIEGRRRFRVLPSARP